MLNPLNQNSTKAATTITKGDIVWLEFHPGIIGTIVSIQEVHSGVCRLTLEEWPLNQLKKELGPMPKVIYPVFPDEVQKLSAHEILEKTAFLLSRRLDRLESQLTQELNRITRKIKLGI